MSSHAYEGRVWRQWNLFPEVSDEELAAVFVLDAADEAGERLLARLKKDRAIEYAEPEVRRRLVS